MSYLTINGFKSLNFSCNFNCCDLINTGINIQLGDRSEIIGFDDEQLKKCFKLVMDRSWVGCYVNGKLVHSPEERDAIKQREKSLINVEEYITNSIQDQGGGKKK